MFFKKYGDIVVSVFFMVLSAVMIFAATLLPKSTVMEIGPDFMPTVVGIVTLILSTALLIISLKGLKTRVAEAEANPPAECDYKRMLISLILILIYVFTLKPVGFIVTTLVSACSDVCSGGRGAPHQKGYYHAAGHRCGLHPGGIFPLPLRLQNCPPPGHFHHQSLRRMPIHGSIK